MFDLDSFLEACVQAGDEDDSRRAIAELLRGAMSRPSDVADAFTGSTPGISVLHCTDDLTVLNVVWAPHMQLPPHDHRMWATIGIYAGREDNSLYRRSAPGAATLEDSGGKELGEGDVLMLGGDAIHSVTNPLERLTGAIHMYGGDFVNEPRSQWGPGEQTERPYDLDYIRSLFDQAPQARP